MGSLSELEKRLGERFLRVHRAYLAAVDKIESVDLKGGRLLVGGRTCLLSRAGRTALKKRAGAGGLGPPPLSLRETFNTVTKN